MKTLKPVRGKFQTIEAPGFKRWLVVYEFDSKETVVRACKTQETCKKLVDELNEKLTNFDDGVYGA